MKTTIEEVRTALVRSKEGVGRPYPEHIRGAVLARAERQRRAGIGLGSFAAEVGVSATTLRKWRRERGAAARSPRSARWRSSHRGRRRRRSWCTARRACASRARRSRTSPSSSGGSRDQPAACGTRLGAPRAGRHAQVVRHARGRRARGHGRRRARRAACSSSSAGAVGRRRSCTGTARATWCSRNASPRVASSRPGSGPGRARSSGP